MTGKQEYYTPRFQRLLPRKIAGRGGKAAGRAAVPAMQRARTELPILRDAATASSETGENSGGKKINEDETISQPSKQKSASYCASERA